MIQEGLELMLIGMGVVFTFLILLVGFMTLSGALFTKFSHLFPEPKAPAAPTPATRPADASDNSAKVAVAIASAYRKRNGS